MGAGRSRALGALRSTFGEGNTAADAVALAAALATVVPILQAAGTGVRA
jgi:cysteine sulfinate desulfinase/cysteine desulfurase-like protein